jgi:predicted GNAT family N-acyltransferase
MALPQALARAALGGEFRVRKVSLACHTEAKPDDRTDVGVRVAHVGDSSLLLACGVFRGDTVLVSAALEHDFIDLAAQTSRPVPPAFREVVAAFQAGEAMTQVQVGDWATLGDQAGAIRKTVFVEEQGIPADLEWDAADATCVHALARNRLGQALATGRLLAYEPGTSKIGRMAVLPSLRGSGVGRQVLEALMAAAKARGDRSVLLHAQASAAPFYLRAGYQAEGEPFDEAGIAHLAMRKVL